MTPDPDYWPLPTGTDGHLHQQAERTSEVRLKVSDLIAFHNCLIEARDTDEPTIPLLEFIKGFERGIA